MRQTIHTARLYLQPLAEHDDHFILELLNTNGWIRFIGDRNIRSLEDAKKYIKTIQNATNISYWVVHRLQVHKRMGIITYIERDYLPGPDIGFAFLDAYQGFGYAYEGASAVMDISTGTLYATIHPENVRSEKLLRNLGFTFERSFSGKNGTENLYAYQRIL